jgi:hypothetical protein
MDETTGGSINKEKAREEAMKTLGQAYIEGKKKAEETQEKPQKKKIFKLPLFVKSKVGKKKYTNHALVVFLRRNREIDLKYTEIYNNVISIENKFYDARADCYYTYGKERVPTLILPEWSLVPIGTKDYQDAVKEGTTTDGQDIIIEGFERKEIGRKKGTGIELKHIIIIVIVALVAAGYFMFKK